MCVFVYDKNINDIQNNDYITDWDINYGSSFIQGKGYAHHLQIKAGKMNL